MVWPILISLSVTPGGYFFCAAAGWASASASVSAGAHSSRFVVVIAFSLSKTCRAQGLSPAAFVVRQRRRPAMAERPAQFLLVSNSRMVLRTRIAVNGGSVHAGRRDLIFATLIRRTGPTHGVDRGAAGLSRRQAGARRLLVHRQHVAEELPGLAVELGELLLLDRVVIGRAGVDLDTRQQHGGLEPLEVRRLLHHVLAREIVTALLQHLHHRRRFVVAEDVEGVLLVAVRIVLVHPGEPRLVGGVVLPIRIGR